MMEDDARGHCPLKIFAKTSVMMEWIKRVASSQITEHESLTLNGAFLQECYVSTCVFMFLLLVQLSN